MIRILEDTDYTYKGYVIQDSQSDGLWYVIDSDNKILGSFSTDEEAEEFIDTFFSTDNKTDKVNNKSNDGLDRLKSETGLCLRKYYSDNYIEVSGKSYKSIQNLIRQYNKKYNTKISCYNDELKDATFIEL